MAVKTRFVTAALALALTSGCSVAVAASGPRTTGSYFATSPSVEIFVAKGGRSVTLYTSCGTGHSVSAYWDSPTLPLRHGAFSFDKPTSVNLVQQQPFSTTQVSATVLFTGKFVGGKFKGKVHLGGSACGEASYTAKYSSRGGGSGG
jgi:hypothetical protein